MKSIINYQLFLGLFLFSTVSIFAQDQDQSVNLSLGSSGFQINKTNKTHIWWNTNKTYKIDISDLSLKGKDLFLSIDSLNNVDFVNQWSQISKTGIEGTPNSYFTLKVNDASLSDNFIPKLSVFSKLEKSIKFDIWFGPETIKYKNGKSHFYKVLNNSYYQFQEIGEGMNLLSKGVRILDPTRLKELALFTDLNADGIDDMIFGNDQIYFNGKIEQIGRGLMVPVYVQPKPGKYTNQAWTLDVSYEDVSSPNSKPASLIHNLDDYTAADLNGDKKLEIVGWGEHYHVGSKPNWDAIAKQLGLIKNVDYKGTGGQPTQYDSAFYAKRFYYYQIENDKWRSKESNIPAYTALTGVFQGAVGDADGDGDVDIVHKAQNGQLMTLINDGKGVFQTSTYSGELVKTFNSESTNRSPQTFIDQLVDIDQDGKKDLVVYYKSTQNGIPNRFVYYRNVGNNLFDLNPVDVIPYVGDFSSTNWMSYDITQAEVVDLNKDGKSEIVLVVSRDYSGETDEVKYKTQSIFKILEINKGNLVDATSTYFKNNTNVLPIMVSNEGSTFSIQDINGDGKLDIVPRFMLRDPAKNDWVNPKNWAGFWNNSEDFQYFKSTSNGFEITGVGKFYDPSSKDYLFNYFEFKDLDKNGDPEVIALYSGLSQIGKKVADFQQNPINWEINSSSKIGDVKLLPIAGLDPSTIVFSFLKNQTIFDVQGNKLILNSLPKVSKDTTFIMPYKIEDIQLNRYTYGQLKITNKLVKEVVLGNQEAIKKAKIIPNPVQNNCFVEFDSSFGSEVKLEITDYLGRLLLVRNRYSPNQLIDMINLKPGVYFVKISSPNSELIEQLKLIKE